MKGAALKVAVIGTGNMGKNHLRVLSTMAEYELVGCFDADEKTCLQQASRYDITPFSSLKNLYEAVDVVHVATPSFLHKQYTIEAAEAGCHVLVEKPIALNSSDAQAIIDACKKAKVRLCIGHVERFNPAIATLQSIVAQEDLISLDFRRNESFLRTHCRCKRSPRFNDSRHRCFKTPLWEMSQLSV